VNRDPSDRHPAALEIDEEKLVVTNLAERGSLGVRELEPPFNWAFRMRFSARRTILGITLPLSASATIVCCPPSLLSQNILSPMRFIQTPPSS
jgi:hypothetical protein